MKTKKLLIWFLAFLPIIVTIVMLPMLSDIIPAHYGAGGEANRWGSKYEQLLFPVFTIAFAAFMVFIGKWEKKQKESVPQNEKVILVATYIVLFMFNGLSYWTLYMAYSGSTNLYKTDMDGMKIVAIIMSISYIFLGNILPKCKQNAIIGIRTKWTLENETVWYKTHRLGGRIIMIFGIVSTLLCLTVLNNVLAFFTIFGGFILITIPIIIYSFVISKKITNNG